MAEEIDPAVIKKTQEILGSVIKKPALLEKSLRKPPFRFLHDIISNIIKTTGFFNGLYTPNELQSDNVKDKESKIAFLQKAIDVLAFVTNQPVNLKPSKVVAGHDPQKTNQFLQTLGTAVKNKLDSKEAVEKVLNVKLQGSPTKAVKERRASVDKRTKGSNEKAHSRSLTKTLDPVKKSSSTSEKKETPKNEKSKDKHKDSKKEREKSRDRSKHKTDDSKKKEKKHREEVEADEKKDDGEQLVQNHQDENQVNNTEELYNVEPSTSMMNGDLHKEVNSGDGDNAEEIGDTLNREKSHRASSRTVRPPSARSKRTKPGGDNDFPVEGDSKEALSFTPAIVSNGPSALEPNMENMLLARPMSARPPSARPSSSRPAPPRIRIRHVVENEEPSLRPATAKPVENVILDQAHQSDEEDETFVVLETEPSEKLDVQNSNVSALTPEEDKGSLVKKLLETKKDLEAGSQQSPSKKVEIDKSQMSEASRTRERDSASKELGQLRSFVQSLSKTAVPLGRMLDFLQEDLDAMKMELKMWREEHEQNLVALHKEKSATESLLEPLQAQLDDLDQVVQNQLDANSALKATISRNDERIQRMLASVNHKS